MSEKYNVVACKSTSDFWIPIYDSLIKHLSVIVENARDMKAFTHKKTDKVDSKFIAQLALNNMIQPSRVFPKNIENFVHTFDFVMSLYKKEQILKMKLMLFLLLKCLI